MHALEIRHLCKTYSNGHVALKGIDLTVKEGDFFALLGPNGAGKSTTISILCSLVNKTAGTVKIFGYDMDRNPGAAKACIGIVPQEFNLPIFDKCLDIVVNQAGYYGIPVSIAKERAEYYLKKLDLWEKRNTPSRNLSGGMKRRLMIARALVHRPKLFILDEPTAGVDIEIRRSMWNFLTEINREGTTIILTTHYLEEAEKLCKRVGIIHHGELITDMSIKEILQNLDIETFVLDVDRKPDISLLKKELDLEVEIVDDRQFIVSIPKGISLNGLFHLLNEQQITVFSMRNTVNRLEELFLRLTRNQGKISP